MSYIQRHVVSVTTATSGVATEYTPVITGRVVSIIYTKATAAVAFASTADFTITLKETSQTLWSGSNVNASAEKVPARQVTTTTGAAVTGVYEQFYAANDKVKIAIAQGGNTKQGTFTVIVA